MRTRLVVIAKSPQPGRVKTRMCPPLTHRQAAIAARAALEDTFHAVLAAEGREPPLIALSGPRGPWLPEGFEVLAQRGEGLAERIASALDDAGGPALLIGMDTPQVGSDMLRSAMDDLESPGIDAVLGPAADGGWWALGLRTPDARALRGVPMSTPSTGAAQRERLRSLGLRTRELPVLRDVDTFVDATEVAREAPSSMFARTLRDLFLTEPPALLHFNDGHTVRLPVERWMDEPGPEELVVLSRAAPPVLDVGCGPGRHVAALLRRGVPALGIDTAPSAVAVARSRGADALERSVFEPLPRSGDWGTVLLLDGNVGIGGDPGRLLRRAGCLVRPGGNILVEVEPPGIGAWRTRARLETAHNLGHWFGWSRVGVGALPRLASDSGLVVRDVWDTAGRWFAILATPGGAASTA